MKEKNQKPKASAEDSMKALLTIIRHRETVADHLHGLADYFRARAREHDRSKLQFDEFEGFARINKTARNHAYGTPEYTESLASENKEGGCIALHFSRNAHHPEFHQKPGFMGLLDLIEMVIDWKAAADTYGTNTLRASIKIQRARFDFDDWQWGVIEEMVRYLEPTEDG